MGETVLNRSKRQRGSGLRGETPDAPPAPSRPATPPANPLPGTAALRGARRDIDGQAYFGASGDICATRSPKFAAPLVPGPFRQRTRPQVRRRWVLEKQGRAGGDQDRQAVAGNVEFPHAIRVSSPRCAVARGAVRTRWPEAGMWSLQGAGRVASPSASRDWLLHARK